MSAPAGIDPSSAEFVEMYDELPLWSAPFGLRLLDRVPLRRGARILDVGAGTGFLSVELAQRCGEQAKVTAVDPWRAALDRLRRRTEFLGLDNIRIIEGDAATLDLPDASFDIIVSNLGINNFENAAGVLRTCRRLCARGGRLLLSSNLRGHMAEFYAVYRDTLIELDQQESLPALERHVAHRRSLEEIVELVSEAGFRTIDSETGSFRWRFIDGKALLRHHFIRVAFLEAWQEIVPVAEVEKTFRTIERNLDRVAADQGELTMTIPFACIEAEPDTAGS